MKEKAAYLQHEPQHPTQSTQVQPLRQQTLSQQLAEQPAHAADAWPAGLTGEDIATADNNSEKIKFNITVS